MMKQDLRSLPLCVLPKASGELEGSEMPLHCIQQEGSLRAQGLHQALQRSPQPFSKYMRERGY